MKQARSRKGAPGILDVAKRAGVSPATVSRFYNAPDVVRPVTRKRIEEAAQDLGYIRDRMAGTMHHGFSGTFGLIVPTIDNAIFSEMIEAFSTRLQEHERTMLIAAHGYDLALETAIVRSLLERRIDGVALVGFDHDTVPFNMLEQRDVPVISIWNYQEDAPLPCIGADNRKAGSLVMQHLVDLGHRDIALLFPETGTNDRARDRLKGALETAGQNGITIASDRLLSCPYDIGESKAFAEPLLRDNRPSAILCCNDVIAHGVVYACQGLGLSLPRDVSVAGIGDFRGSEHMEPGLTTVRLPARRIGRLAADTLLTMCETGMMPNPPNLAIELVLKKRGSTARIAD